MEGALRERSVDRIAFMGVKEDARRGVLLDIVVDDEVDTKHDVLGCHSTRSRLGTSRGHLLRASLSGACDLALCFRLRTSMHAQVPLTFRLHGVELNWRVHWAVAMTDMHACSLD